MSYSTHATTGSGSTEKLNDAEKELPSSYHGSFSRGCRYGYEYDKHVKSMSSRFNEEYERRRDQDKKMEECRTSVSYDGIRVEACEFFARDNALEHHTEMYEIVKNDPARPVYRRGLSFLMEVKFQDRKFDPEHDHVRLVFNFGPNPTVPKDTKIVIPLTGSKGKDKKEKIDQWEARIKHIDGKSAQIEVCIPADAPVGVWKCWIETSPDAFNQEKSERVPVCRDTSPRDEKDKSRRGDTRSRETSPSRREGRSESPSRRHDYSKEKHSYDKERDSRKEESGPYRSKSYHPGDKEKKETPKQYRSSSYREGDSPRRGYRRETSPSERDRFREGRDSYRQGTSPSDRDRRRGDSPYERDDYRQGKSPSERDEFGRDRGYGRRFDSRGRSSPSREDYNRRSSSSPYRDEGYGSPDYMSRRPYRRDDRDERSSYRTGEGDYPDGGNRFRRDSGSYEMGSSRYGGSRPDRRDIPPFTMRRGRSPYNRNSYPERFGPFRRGAYPQGSSPYSSRAYRNGTSPYGSSPFGSEHGSRPYRHTSYEYGVEMRNPGRGPYRRSGSYRDEGSPFRREDFERSGMYRSQSEGSVLKEERQRIEDETGPYRRLGDYRRDGSPYRRVRDSDREDSPVDYRRESGRYRVDRDRGEGYRYQRYGSRREGPTRDDSGQRRDGSGYRDEQRDGNRYGNDDRDRDNRRYNRGDSGDRDYNRYESGDREYRGSSRRHGSNDRRDYQIDGSRYRRDGSSYDRDESRQRRDGSSYRRDGSSYRRDGSDYRRDGSNYRRDGSDYRRDGDDYRRDGSSYRRDGSSYRREGSNYRRDGSSYRRDGSSYGKDGSNYGRDGSSYRRDGSDYRREGSEYRRDGNEYKRGENEYQRGRSGYSRNGNGSRRNGSGYRRGGSGYRRDDSDYRRDGSDYRRYGSDYRRDGSDYRKDGSDRRRDRSGYSRDNSERREDNRENRRDENRYHKDGRKQQRDGSDYRRDYSRNGRHSDSENRRYRSTSDGRDFHRDSSDRRRDDSDNRRGRRQGSSYRRDGRESSDYQRDRRDGSEYRKDRRDDSDYRKNRRDGSDYRKDRRDDSDCRKDRRDDSDYRRDGRDRRDGSDYRRDGSDCRRDGSNYRRDGRDRRDGSDYRRDGSDYRRDRRDGSDYRRDGSDYRRDGSDYRRDGSDYRMDRRDGSDNRRDRKDGSDYRRDRRDDSDYRRDGSDNRRDRRDGSDYRRDGKDGNEYRKDRREGSDSRRDRRDGSDYRRDGDDRRRDGTDYRRRDRSYNKDESRERRHSPYRRGGDYVREGSPYKKSGEYARDERRSERREVSRYSPDAYRSSDYRRDEGRPRRGDYDRDEDRDQYGQKRSYYGDRYTRSGYGQKSGSTSYDSRNRKGHVFKCKQDIYILFNPWCKEDSTYMENDMWRNEYVLNDVGKIWVGTYGRNKGRSWVFGQFDDVVLPAVMYLLEEARMGATERGNPVRVVRAISEMVNNKDYNNGLMERKTNSQPENSVMMGRWDGNYDDGVSPYSWTGSVKILEQYLRTGKSVKYGQCWVFSAVTTTICRALGIPCRSVTNFVSAHDTNNSLCIDKYFSCTGDEIEGGPDGDSWDSVWNFHSWNDVWMARPDLPSGYGGWQAIDSTFQEESDGRYKCGPASLESIRRGEIGFCYDTPFLYSEVNAEVNHWQEDEESEWGFTRMKNGNYHVGRQILTKRHDRDDDDGDNDVEDVLREYRPKDGFSKEQHNVMCALHGVERGYLSKNTSYQYKGKDDVSFELVDIDRVQIGLPFTVAMEMTNKSGDTRNVQAMLSCHSVYYTGVKNRRIKQHNGHFVLKPNQRETMVFKVTPEEYQDKMVDYAMIKIYAVANVRETKQAWGEEDDFYFEKPRLGIQTRGNNRVNEEMEVNLSFTNPLNITLTNCKFSFEAPGMRKPKIAKFRDVRPGEMVSFTDKCVPKNNGNTKIVGNFSSHQLNEVTGCKSICIREN